MLWEHIFWIFGHPEVYILILPAFGVISEVISTFSRKRLFGYSSMVFATVLIGFLGFMVWAHHMFTTGLGPVANALFSIATMLIAVPTGIKIFNWLFTMWGGSIRFTTANLFAIGFIPTFVMGGVTGVMLAAAPADFQYHDSLLRRRPLPLRYRRRLDLRYFLRPALLVAEDVRTHAERNTWQTYVLDILHRLPPDVLRAAFPRLDGDAAPRIDIPGRQGFNKMNMISTIGAFLMGVGRSYSCSTSSSRAAKPRNAADDPWEDGRTLEWTIPSPPPEYNFKQTPLVRGYDA